MCVCVCARARVRVRACVCLSVFLCLSVHPSVARNWSVAEHWWWLHVVVLVDKSVVLHFNVRYYTLNPDCLEEETARLLCSNFKSLHEIDLHAFCVQILFLCSVEARH